MPILIEIILAQFDEKIGPIPFLYSPNNVLKITLNTVANVTIDFFKYSKEISDDLAIMTFPRINKKGLVRFIQWEDPSRRGRIMETAFTILFEEKDDSILYKYEEDLKIIINAFLEQFLPLIKKNERKEILQSKLNSFYTEIQNSLKQLASRELQMLETSEEFPQLELAEIPKFVLKVIALGDPHVGKTSLILKFTDNAFLHSYIPTIGTNITEKKIIVENCLFHLVLWDIAGQSKFSNFRHQYYKGAQCVIMIFDLTDRKTFKNIKKWYTDFNEELKNLDKIEIALCGNKFDLHDQIQITKAEGKKLASELNIEYFETSAQTGKDVVKVYHTLVQNLIAKGKIKM